MLPLFIGPALLVAAAHANYEVTLRTEARGAADGAGDLQLNPGLGLSAPIGSVTLAGSYTPRILVQEESSRGGTSVLHRAALRGQWRTGRRARLLLEQQLEYGKNPFSLLAAAAEGTLSFDRLSDLPTTELQTLLYINEVTTLRLEQPLGQKLHFLGSASYTVSGGADQIARSFGLPLQRGPGFALSLTWLARSRDTLTVSLGGVVSYFSTQRHVYLVETTAAWRHRFSRYELELGLGASGVRGEGADQPAVAYARPVGTVRLLWEAQGRRGQRFGGSLRARVAPIIDPRSGLTYTRAEGLAGLDYLPVAKLRLSATTASALALGGPFSGQVVGLAGVGASYELDRHLAITAGVRLAAQARTRWVGFVAASLFYREPW